MGITFYESDLEVVITPYTDHMVITTTIADYRMGQLLVNKSSVLSLLYLNYWYVMGLKDELIIKDVGELIRLNGLTSQPYREMILDIALHYKVVSIDFYLM